MTAFEWLGATFRKLTAPRVVSMTVPACYRIRAMDDTIETAEKVHDAYQTSIILGPEEAVEYDYQVPGYVYGAPIGDPTDPNHPKDRDGFLMRRRSKVLSWGGAA